MLNINQGDPVVEEPIIEAPAKGKVSEFDNKLVEAIKFLSVKVKSLEASLQTQQAKILAIEDLVLNTLAQDLKSSRVTAEAILAKINEEQ